MTLRYGTSQTKLMSNSQKIKPTALAVIKLCLHEVISQTVSHSLENKFLEAIWVDLRVGFT